jgi:hypothetical protein
MTSDKQFKQFNSRIKLLSYLGAYTISLDPILLLPLHVICPREFCEAPVTTSYIILLSDVIRFFLRWWAPSRTDDEDKLFSAIFSKGIISQVPETSFVLHKTSKTIAAAAADYIQIITVVHACLMIQAIKIQKP